MPDRAEHAGGPGLQHHLPRLLPAGYPHGNITVLGRILESGTILNNASSSHCLILFLQLLLRFLMWVLGDALSVVIPVTTGVTN